MASPTPRVVVLLSTYNGARYLPAQLDSLRAQEGVSVELHVRDDGSTDDTLQVLASYAHVWPNLAEVESGPNLRPAASFLELLRTAPEDADYYAFCDQDDVWLPGKLARATAALKDGAGPALYCSNVTCVAEDLTVIGSPPPNGDGRFQHLLFENIAYGCTTVLNASVRSLVASRPPEQGVVMHDWWCALVVSALGRIVYDETPSILYRQHGGNSIGAEVSSIVQTVQQIGLLIKRRRDYYRIHAQAAEFLRVYEDRLAFAERVLIQALVDSKRSWVSRLQYAFSGQVSRSRVVGDLAARTLIVMGWY